MPTLTPRWVLQYWGTEVCRRGFHDDIWIASLENKLRTSKDSVVISDCRFPNEIASIKNTSGKIIWVQRGELPDWYDLALEENLKNSEAAKFELIKRKVHASETAWVGTDFDHVIENNGTIDELYKKIALIISDEITLLPSDALLA
jgi:hypothetical protein